MAEGVVGLVIVKLGAALASEAAKLGCSLLGREASALAALFSEIREIKGELEGMQAFLRAAERFKDTDETTATFVKQIRSLGFEIEDVVDEFTFKLGEQHGEGFFPKTIIKKLKYVKTWHRLTSKLQEIKVSLKNTAERRVRYDMKGIDKEPRPQDGGSSSWRCGVSAHFAKEEDLVGIKENKELLIRWLRDDQRQRIKIASVWGMGGVGKTTLVAHVYNTIKLDFDACAWITVSQNYQADDLLRLIVQELRKNDHKKELPDNINNTDRRSLVEMIRNYLHNKRYVLILDDVWNADAWYEIKDAFAIDSAGRIIITSRNHEVALLAAQNCIIELKPLKEQHSWELFCKEAFGNNEDRAFPPELEHWAEKFVEKCNGLPIAIVCIARVLSLKKPTCLEWEKVYANLEVQLTNNHILNVNIVLKVSLEDLPYNLKNCFLYCSIFPEDYRIKRKRLIRLWVAEGFIEETGSNTMEEVAEDYINQLVNRSLLQVVSRNEFGRVRECQMHDVIRVLALTKSREESFCEVDSSFGSHLRGQARRLSVQSSNIDQLNEDAFNLRSLVIFDGSKCFKSLNNLCRSLNLLSVLDLQGVQVKSLPHEVSNLFNLRFLGLRHTAVESLPRSIGRLQNLLVLDAYDAKLVHVPQEVATLHKLRHLLVVTVPKEDYGKVVPFNGVAAPKGIWKLVSLQTLQLVEENAELLRHLGALTELRTFCISKVTTDQFIGLSKRISKMNHLVHLEILAKDETEILQIGTLHLPRSISKLCLSGQLEKRSIVDFSLFARHLSNLTHLRLGFSKLDEDSFPCLLELRGLLVLDLASAYDGKKLHFHAASFPELQKLFIWDAPQLKQIEIEQGAMSNLLELWIVVCPELKVLPRGIEHLVTLKELQLKNTAEELIGRLRKTEKPNKWNEDRKKIQHIKKVIVQLDSKNVWERIQ